MGVEGDLKLIKGDTQSTQTVGGPSDCFQPALETNQKGPTAGSECGGRPSSPLQTSQKRQGHPQVLPVQLR